MPHLLEFLARAVPIYEQAGGIRVNLLQDQNDPTRFIEQIEYASQTEFERDQIRVHENPIHKRLIEEWRELLSEPPVVEVWSELDFKGGRHNPPRERQGQD